MLRCASLLVPCAALTLGSPTANPTQQRSRAPFMNLLDIFSGKGNTYGGDCVMGEEEIMSQKAHGTSNVPVQKALRWNCAPQIADNVCNFNRHYAENSGYWERSTTFLSDEARTEGDVIFYDSNTGLPLFYAPRERSWEGFVRESRQHGWPSFRDSEVNWDLVRVLPNGECGESVALDLCLQMTCFPLPVCASRSYSPAPGPRRIAPLLPQSRRPAPISVTISPMARATATASSEWTRLGTPLRHTATASLRPLIPTNIWHAPMLPRSLVSVAGQPAKGPVERYVGPPQ
jgi:hypothetical protein